MYDGEQLNLTRITRNEMGAYLCIATNGVPPTVSKRITVDVECEFVAGTPGIIIAFVRQREQCEDTRTPTCTYTHVHLSCGGAARSAGEVTRARPRLV